MHTKIYSWAVTGGAGFIGSHAVCELVSRGQRVTVVDDFSSGSADNLNSVRGKIRLVRGDVRDSQALESAFQGVDFVLHHAALVSVPRSVEDPQLTWDVNVLGTVNVLEAARRAGVKRVVFASSCSVYGTSSKPCKESAPLRPGSPYALSKQIGEELCRFYTDAYGLDTVCLRYFNVYGPGQNAHAPYSAVIAKFMDLARRGEVLPVEWDGRQSRDFISVQDVVRANLLAARKGKSGETYNVAGGKSFSLLALIDTLEKICGRKLPRVRKPKRAGDVRFSAADTVKFTRLGFKPRVSLETGLARLWKTVCSFSEN